SVKDRSVYTNGFRMTRHHWTEQDDIAALYLYKFGSLGRAPTIDAVARNRGMSADSLRMRVSNFHAIDTGSGLSHSAQLSTSVYPRYANLSEPELRKLAGF